MRITTRLAIGGALLVAAAPAPADTCAPPTPECHKKNGEKLLASNPKAAAAELLASYRLDERTDTLTLYAQAVQADGQYALALETWQRVIVFRESEVEAAKEAMAGRDKKKKAAAAGQQKLAQQKSEEAAAEIMKLWPKVAKVKLANTGAITVTRGGIEVDATREILVNAGRDELVITPAGGSPQVLVVEVASQQTKTIEVPTASAQPAPAVPAPSTVTPAEDAPGVETQMEVDASLRPDAAPRSTTMSKVGLGLGAAGIVGVGVGTTFALLAASDFSDAKDLGCDDDGTCPVGAATRRAERSNDRARVAQIGLYGGGALLATGVVLYILGKKETRHEERRVSVSITPSSVGLSWSLQ